MSRTNTETNPRVWKAFSGCHSLILSTWRNVRLTGSHGKPSAVCRRSTAISITEMVWKFHTYFQFPVTPVGLKCYCKWIPATSIVTTFSQ